MIADLLEGFSAKVSVLAVDMKSGAEVFALESDARVPAASTIKVPILLAALELFDDLDETVWVSDILPDSEVFERGAGQYSLLELLTWMIVRSDNTATNFIIGRVGFDGVNALCARLRLRSTRLARMMLDTAAAARGEDNFTSARDQFLLYRALYDGAVKRARVALDILRRQRSFDALLRYIADPVTFAHKTGGLAGVCHDAGVFEGEKPLYLGVFTWDGDWADGSPAPKQMVGAIGKQIWEEWR